MFFSYGVKHVFVRIRSSRPEVFLRKAVLKLRNKFTGEHPCRSVISIKLQRNWNHTSARVFSSKYAAYFQNTFSQERLWMAASINLDCFTSWIDWYFFYFFYSILTFSFIRNLRIAILIFYVWRWIYFMVLWSQSLRFMNSNDRWKVWTAGLLHEIRFHILLKFQFVR